MPTSGLDCKNVSITAENMMNKIRKRQLMQTAELTKNETEGRPIQKEPPKKHTL